MCVMCNVVYTNNESKIAHLAGKRHGFVKKKKLSEIFITGNKI